MNHYAGAARADGVNRPRIDLRSDTVTRPDAAMRRAMADAEVGDDVYGDDPNVNRLEAVLAERLGKEAALFVPSGTMSNLLALLSHCGRGEEVIVGRAYHIAADEAAGASVLGSMALTTLPVDDDGGLSPEAITAEVKPDDSHKPISRLVCLENTFQGRAVPLARMQAAAEAARAEGLATHLDGARFFNAITALGCTANDLAGITDSVSICLSKGLGTPVGSVLTGPRDLITRARRWRKMLGGGMRQAGVLAAAGLHALEHNVHRLAEDHANAVALAEALTGMEAGAVRQATNMVFFEPRGGVHDEMRNRLAASGILLGGGTQGAIRLVLHKDINGDDLDYLIEEFRSIFA
ncbi:MAG: low-specificity L-threonine aldolase [Silicimonas sp.]|nr:low-specificity L-threonine aldolase [Silicimonas sp.]